MGATGEFGASGPKGQLGTNGVVGFNGVPESTDNQVCRDSVVTPEHRETMEIPAHRVLLDWLVQMGM